MSVELRHLRALVAVADCGTFTDAAIELGVSQAAVSRSVAALESSLGVTLLRRTTRQVDPSPAGATVIARARRILAEVEDLRRAADETRSELRLGYAWSALGRHTTALQRTWARRHPSTRLLLIHSNTPSAGLAEGLADLAVVRRPLNDARFSLEPVATEARYVAMAADDAWARRRSVRLGDFTGRTVLVDARTGTTTPHLWPQDEGPAEFVDSHSMDTWLNVIAAGEAVGMTAEATVQQYPRPGIVYRPVRDAPPLPVWLAWWKGEAPPLTPALITLIRELYEGPRP
ncbi:LysR family transcriptional regulator [Kineosporia succinea]|uniref:DNA-binding transcriptional LysR family regulator n=1 Tax=Kineosporia succinea TaxID=84632 RepID=A0ABT9P4L1_9ACTN|nr:LysR family transcriptional regulator [Kineosporia succinea]MDP9827629.1 DNA-binding transcriptional LysR family regulator [Kineosporia succinea]